MAVLAILSLALCLAAPALYVWGPLDADGYKALFLIASVAWFAAAGLYDTRRGRQAGK